MIKNQYVSSEYIFSSLYYARQVYTDSAFEILSFINNLAIKTILIICGSSLQIRDSRWFRKIMLGNKYNQTLLLI